MDVYGLMVLTVVLVVAGALQTAAIFGALFGLHKYAPEQFPESTVGTLDLDHLQKAQVSDFLSRLGAVVFTPTLVLHVLEFLCVGVYIRAHPVSVGLVLAVLQTSTIAAGLRFFVKLEPARAAILSAFAGAFYILLLWSLIYGYLQ